MSETVTATATDAAQTNAADAGKATADASTTAEPWYSRLSPSEDDVKIYGKYKDQDAALRAIPHAERRARSAIPFPAADAKSEDAVKAHREILTKLGAHKDIKGYEGMFDAAVEKLPESLRSRISSAWREGCCKEGLENHQLPWQFESMLASAFSGMEAGLQSEEDAKIDQQNKLEKALKVRHGVKWEGHVTNAERVAAELDKVLMENSKGLEGEDGNPVKDAFTQALKDHNDPRLYAGLDHLFEIMLSEGDGGPRRLGGKADDAYTTAYNTAKARFPARGEEFWARSAKEATGGGR